MARFRFDDAEKYGNQTTSTGFFGLKDDGDVARVRFMYRDMNDVEGLAVHEVEIDGRRRYVNCLRSYDEPLDNCPFCKSGRFQLAKLYIPLYDVDSGTVKVWERGKKFFGKISSICTRYGRDGEICSHVFEIERHGKKGDQTTTYEIYEVDKDDTTLDDLPELPKIVGSIVLDKNADEMREYLETGSFGDSPAPVRRDSNREPIRRRTPATSEVF